MNHKGKSDKNFIKKPIYPGGNKAMQELVKASLVYPQEAKDNAVEGTVYLSYDIDYKGMVSRVVVLSGLGSGCDEEAVRVVKLFKFDIPDIPYRQKVKFNKKIQIHFKLNKVANNPEPTPPSQAVENTSNLGFTYSYTTVAPAAKINTQDPKGLKKTINYSYTVNIK